MARVCKECAKKNKKIYMKVARKAVSMIVYVCPKCDKRVIINRK